MKLLHTMLRVGNLEESSSSTANYGDEVTASERLSRGEFTLAFVGYGDEYCHTVLEQPTTGVNKYDLGNAYGHIAIGVDDIYGTCEQIKSRGGKVVREAGPMKQ